MTTIITIHKWPEAWEAERKLRARNETEEWLQWCHEVLSKSDNEVRDFQ